jgi:hypothetical protein
MDLVVGFGVIGVEPWSSATTDLVIKMDLREIGCEDERWIELAENHAQWWALVLQESKFGVLSPSVSYVFHQIYLQCIRL